MIFVLHGARTKLLPLRDVLSLAKMSHLQGVIDSISRLLCGWTEGRIQSNVNRLVSLENIFKYLLHSTYWSHFLRFIFPWIMGGYENKIRTGGVLFVAIARDTDIIWVAASMLFLWRGFGKVVPRLGALQTVILITISSCFFYVAHTSLTHRAIT